jgi:uncharacterized membrane protein
MHHETSIEITASPELIWSTLSEVERWPEWTNSVTEVERLDTGDFGVGSRVRVKQPGMPRLTWEVTEYAPGEVFSWASKLPGVTTTGGHRFAPGPSGRGSGSDVPSGRASGSDVPNGRGSGSDVESGRASGSDVPSGRVTVTLTLDHEGFLAPVVWRLTGSRSRRYVQMEAEGLKRRCESSEG